MEQQSEVEARCIDIFLLPSRAANPVCEHTHCSDVQAFRGIWRMQQGSQGPNSCRLSYALFVRPQVWLMHAVSEDCHCRLIAQLYCIVPKCKSMHKACHLKCVLIRACLFWLVHCFTTQLKLTHVQNCMSRYAIVDTTTS